jgi:hypothetical protein
MANPPPSNTTTPPDSSTTAEEIPAKDHPIGRILFRSHHLLFTQKRKSIISWCSELQLWGASKIGYPGIIIVEGGKDGVDEFARRIKSLNWLALNVRWEEESTEEKLGPVIDKRVDSSRLRVVEVESVSEVGEIMRVAGLEKMFQSVFRLG